MDDWVVDSNTIQNEITMLRISNCKNSRYILTYEHTYIEVVFSN